MIRFFAKTLALLPLRLTHAIGVMVGVAFHLVKPNARRILEDNLKQTGLYPNEADFKQAVKENVAHTGKSFIEALAIWGADQKRALSWVTEVKGQAAVDAAVERGKGIIFLTPHMGCFEITSIAFGAHYPITILYRPPGNDKLERLMVDGRGKGQVALAKTDKTGVKAMLQGLKRGEAIGILPDQTANQGEGEWAPIFGRPAYTMVLASKFAQKTDASVFIVFGERLPKGQGYIVHYTPLPQGAIATPTLLNQVIETQIRACPEQYIWNYNRHKGEDDIS